MSDSVLVILPDCLLVNNICFAFFGRLPPAALCRRTVESRSRYGAAHGSPAQSWSRFLAGCAKYGSIAQRRVHLCCRGDYGEKRDLGYLGTTIMYAGLFILLAYGSWDNLQQFSGVVLDGMGPPTNLNKVESYRKSAKGQWPPCPTLCRGCRSSSSTCRTRIYPMGATEVIFYC